MLSEKLKELRLKNKDAQADIAKVIGVSRQAYNNYEAGIRTPDSNTLVALANYFGVTTDYLLGRTDTPMPVSSAASFVDGKSYEDMPEEALQQLREYEAFLREKYKKK